jgi:hypothetical protein
MGNASVMRDGVERRAAVLLLRRWCVLPLVYCRSSQLLYCCCTAVMPIGPGHLCRHQLGGCSQRVQHPAAANYCLGRCWGVAAASVDATAHAVCLSVCLPVCLPACLPVCLLLSHPALPHLGDGGEGANPRGHSREAKQHQPHQPPGRFSLTA